MIIAPYRVQTGQHSIPVLTVALIILCLSVFSVQFINNRSIENTLFTFCVVEIKIHRPLYRGRSDEHKLYTCQSLYRNLYYAQDRNKVLDLYLSDLKNRRTNPGLIKAYTGYITLKEKEFRKLAPADFSSKLIYKAGSWDLWRMLTSVFAHGSWIHVLGNIFFLFLFGAAIEQLIGRIWFAVLFLFLVYLSYVGFSLAYTIEAETETVGISGVIMGMVGFCALLVPHARVKWFAWLLITNKQFQLPMWQLSWFIIICNIILYIMLFGNTDINFLLHLTGALAGMIAIILLPSRLKRLAKFKVTLPEARMGYLLVPGLGVGLAQRYGLNSKYNIISYS